MNRTSLGPMPKNKLLIAVVLLASSFVGACQSDPPLEVAPSVSLSQLQGKWYEIARLPRMTQVDCHGTTAFYTPSPDGSIGLVNQCNVGSATGKLQTIAMTATVPDSSVPAKLALKVGGYTGDYWILEVGPNDEYTVVGHPSRLYLWILSRTPTLDESLMSGILARAEAAHFDTSKLEYTPQPPAGDRNGLETPQGTVPEGPHPSCSLAQGPAGKPDAAPAFTAIIGLMLAMGVRRRSRAS